MKYQILLLLPLIALAACSGSDDKNKVSQSTFDTQAAELDKAKKTIIDLTGALQTVGSDRDTLVSTRNQANKDIQGYLDKIAADDRDLAAIKITLSILQAKLDAAPTQAERDALTAQIAKVKADLDAKTTERDVEMAGKVQAIKDRDEANARLLQLARNLCGPKSA